MEPRTPSTAPVDGRAASVEEQRLAEALSAGDEKTFVELFRLYSPSMLRVARLYVSSRAIAEEVVQETWLAVLTGIGSFEGRSSFKTWLFGILANRARKRAAKEGRSVPFSSLGDEEAETFEPSVAVDRFRGAGERFADHWISSPNRWPELPEASLLSQETHAVIEKAVASLPPAQRAVITLRDILGWDAHETCDILELTPANQRVLLHRARTKVRNALQRHLASS
jgi:RNA polymerase sigma-70 factor, ECF subfamily